jgi:hypothetical protein
MPPPRIPRMKLPVAKKISGLNTYREEGVDPNMYAMNAGSLWDEELNKFAPYRELIKHPNEEIKNRWLKSGEDEFGRLFQGFEPNGIEGMNVLRWIHKKAIPANKSVTYPRYTVAYRPEKADPNRTRITAGGDRLEYDGNVTTHTASLETIKTHWNSVISTPGAKYCTGDISNMYLESALEDPEYVRFKWEMIPPRIREHYKLDQYVVNGFVYALIAMAWYGLKQSGKIAHDDLVAHLAKSGYKKAKYTQGLFFHETRDISFTLVVDDFGIKYMRQEDVDHLVAAVKSKYKFKVDMEGKQYIGIHLDWDYQKRQLITSMQGYVEQALKELEHAMPLKPCHAPSKAERPSYGAKIQYAKEDDSPELKPKDVKFIQRTTGKFLYYGRTVDITMQHALNDIATTKDRQSKMEATKYFLDYAATHPNAKVIYRASDMILQVDSDAAYLVCSGARSRMGGYFYLGNKDNKLHNGAILVLAKIIKNVMSSAAEAETGALFMNAQEAIPIRRCLQELGHEQPATRIRTDNSTACGFANETIKQKKSKSFDMRFNWLLDQEQRSQFDIKWEAGKNNLADYMTKHHPASHHQQVRPIYLYEPGKSPETVQGCVEILNRAATKKPKPSALTATEDKFTSTENKTSRAEKKVRFSFPLTNAAPPKNPRKRSSLLPLTRQGRSALLPRLERSILRPSKYTRQ